MSTIADSSRAAADVIRAGARSEGYKAIISQRAVRSSRGYHAGRSEIYGPNGQGDRDYSVRRKRDKAGLSNASAAMDISFRGDGSKKAQHRFTTWLASEAKAKRADLQEVIGPGPDGRAYDYRKPLWKPIGPRPLGDSHEYHTHVSFPRDTEFSDRASQFKGFFPQLNAIPSTPDDPEMDVDPEPEPSGPTQEELDAAIDRAEEAEAKLAVIHETSAP